MFIRTVGWPGSTAAVLTSGEDHTLFRSRVQDIVDAEGICTMILVVSILYGYSSGVPTRYI